MIRQKLSVLFLSVISFAFIVSCGGSSVEVITILPVGNEMKYKQTEFTVKAGSQVKIIMNNTATSPAMVHNVVITDIGTDIGVIGQDALTAGPDKGYLPDSDAIIAATGLAQPGQQTEVTFKVPDEPGDYPYVCTYPGHWQTMNGIMKVVE